MHKSKPLQVKIDELLLALISFSNDI